MININVLNFYETSEMLIFQRYNNLCVYIDNYNNYIDENDYNLEIYNEMIDNIINKSDLELMNDSDDNIISNDSLQFKKILEDDSELFVYKRIKLS